MKINLNKCKAGDKLRRRDGKIMTYMHKCEDGRHKLKYPKTGIGFWTSKGFFAYEDSDGLRLDSDIVGFVKGKNK